MTLADEIAQEFQDAAPEFVEAFHESWYLLKQRVSDGNGGWTDADPVVVEGPTRCMFGESRSFGSTQRGENIFVSLSPYTAELPKATIATEQHLIEINGRDFLIVDVKRGGNWDMFTYLSLEERNAEVGDE